MKKQESQNDKAIISFFIGAILAICIVLFGFKFLAEKIPELIIGFIILIIFLGLTFLFVTLKKEWIFSKILGLKNKKITNLKDDLEEVADGIITNDLNKVGNSSKKTIATAVSLYTWVSYRKWVISVFYTLLLGFAGLLGSVLVLNQNKLISSQNRIISTQTELIKKQSFRLDQQTYLQEADRRSSLVFLLGNITDAIDREIRTDVEKKSRRDLTLQLVGRIVALSRSLRPYRYLEGDSLIKKPLSPERGQLLIALLESNIDSSSMKIIYSKGNFTRADLNGANLNGVDLSNINLQGSNLDNAKLQNANLENSNLIGSSIQKAKFNGAILNGTYLSESVIDSSDFKGAEINGPYFRNASLKYADFSGGKVTADFEGANLSNALMGSITHVAFKKANLDSLRVYDIKFLNQIGIEASASLRNHYSVDTIAQKDKYGDLFYYLKSKVEY